MLVGGILSGLAALCITVYPLVGNYLSDRNRSTVLTEYTAAVEEMDAGNIDDFLAAARAYNESLMPGVLSIENVFTRQGQEYAAEDYYGLLNIDANGIMGYVEIPKISVYLPIYHGTDAATLEKGVGHLIGSSLPVGGKSTHSILTGHSGMAREKMFSDLEQLSVGDTFFIHLLDKTLAYQVDQIKVVLPENTDYLGIRNGEDLCTLVTCTPFGVNTHRLLVRGSRIEYAERTEAVEDSLVLAEEVTAPSTWEQQYIKGLVIGAGLAAVIGALVLINIYGKRGKHEKKRR